MSFSLVCRAMEEIPRDAEGRRREKRMANPVRNGDLPGIHADGHTESDGKPVKLHRKYHKQHHCHPECRGAGHKQGISRHDPVHDPTALFSCENAEEKAKNTRNNHAVNKSQMEFMTLSPDDLCHRTAI